jgi:hypothetical protein
MHGTKMNYLPPSYLLILVSTFMVFMYYIVKLDMLIFALKYNLLATILFAITALELLVSLIFNYLDYIKSIDLIIYIIYLISYYLIGLYLGQHISSILNYFDKHKQQINIFIIFLLFIFFIILLISNQYNIEKVLYGFGNKIPHAGIHLIISDMLAIMILYKITKSKNIAILILWFCVGVLVEFILGSRAAFMFFLFSGILALFLKKKIYLFYFLFFLVILSVLFNQEIFDIFEQQQRFASLFSMNMHDDSLIKREYQLAVNYAFIEKNYFTGLIMSERITLGKGAYIHSYISYLQNYGIVYFLILNILILNIFWKFFQYLDIKKINGLFMFVSYVYIVLEFIFARGYISYHLFMFLMIFEAYGNYLKGARKNAEQFNSSVILS